MKHKISVAIILYDVFSHYKRFFPKISRKDFASDMKQCDILLEKMIENDEIPPATIKKLVDRINQWGYQISLPKSIEYGDYQDSEVTEMMLRIVEEILKDIRFPIYLFRKIQIHKRLMALHNLPRVLLANDITDFPSHMEKEDAIESVNRYLSNSK